METRPATSPLRWAPFGASAAPPGAVVFHRYLQQLNAEHRVTPAPTCRLTEDRVELSRHALERHAACAIQSQSPRPSIPRIGDTPEPSTEPSTEPVPRAITELILQQRTPSTGRLIDILA